MKRKSGILMPIFSLPSKYGIGSFGKESYKFVDFLVESGQSVWQILPLVATGYGNSPYSSCSTNSFNPYFISLEELKKEKLLTVKDLKEAEYFDKYIDYGFIYNIRFKLLRRAFNRFNRQDKKFVKFKSEKEFHDYALFMAIKTANDHKHFYEWEDGLKYRDKTAIKNFENEFKDEIEFWEFTQFYAKSEWLKLKKYANSKGIKIMGDMPLYTSLDSVDVWVNPRLFFLNEDFVPKKVAGVPPDYFSTKGQLWGNPVYDYDYHKLDGFSWWENRLKNALKMFDYVRIDHFRGLDRFYQVDFDREDATIGEWIKVPSIELFDTLKKEIDFSKIIAEDLGIIDDGVRKLLDYTGFPGMKILSFAFNGEPNNLYLPENINSNSVCYTGTHDNDTLKGLTKNCSEWDKNNLIFGVKNSLKKFGIKIKGELTDELLDKYIIELGFACKSNLFIMPYQDAVLYSSDYRINEPGTINNNNWSIRFCDKDFSKKVSNYLLKLTTKYKRS